MEDLPCAKPGSWCCQTPSTFNLVPTVIFSFKHSQTLSHILVSIIRFYFVNVLLYHLLFLFLFHLTLLPHL